MKPRTIPTTLLLTLACALAASTARPQDESGLSRPLTLAPGAARAHQWSVPLNFMVNQMLKAGKQPIQLQLDPRYYAEGPSDGPEWGLRFTVSLFF